MNRITLKYRILCLILFILSAFVANALTLNPLIEAPDGHRIVNQEPLLFDEKIIFVTEKDRKHSLWAYDLDNNSYLELESFENYIVGKFYVINNHFYFKERYEPSQVWKSDGTVSGTQSVTGLLVGRTYLHQQNNILYNKGTGFGTRLMIFFNGSTIKYYESPSIPLDQSVCAFNINDVVIPSLQTPSSNTINLIRFKNGSQTNYTSTLTQAVETNQGYSWFFDNTCFVYLYGQDLEDILVIPAQGEPYFLGEQLGYESVSYLTKFKDHYYAVASDEQYNSKIIKLSSDLTTVENNTTFGHIYDIMTLSVSDQYLIGHVRSGGGVSPPYWHTNFFDNDLNEVPDLGGPMTYVPEIKAKYDGEVVVYTDYSGQVDLQTLTLDITNQSSGLIFNRSEINDVITNKSSIDAYVLLQDLQSNQSSIQKLDSIPDMGSLSVGNWFDPDYQSQGMSIVEGLRDDGTRYLFVTLYLFQDGQPLWLAGTSNINYPQPTLDIELGAYNGLGLWQADTPANVEKFADMTLSMSGCHQMMVNFVTVDGQTFSLELQRMVNNDINLKCKD